MLLITAGPTCEDIDAVRYITNRATGRLGIELAIAAVAVKIPTTLILGPTALKLPPELPDNLTLLPVRSAADMHKAVIEKFPDCSALIMTAAVADYTPASLYSGKRKKQPGDWHLHLVRTVDILADIGQRADRVGKLIIGFALETDLQLEEAQRKLQSKNLDIIVLNNITAFGESSPEYQILYRDGTLQTPGNLNKPEFAQILIDLVINRCHYT